MKLEFRQRIALAATVALLALPLGPAAMPPNPATAVPMSVAAVEDSNRTSASTPTPNQSALAQYIAATYRKPLRYARDIVRTTVEVAQKYALPPNLLLAIMAKESGFDESARSTYGARGLMQVVPRYHMGRLQRNETKSSFKEPRTNIRVGAHILAEYLAAHKDLDAALKQYSGSSRGYSRAVRTKWDKFEKVGQHEQAAIPEPS